MSLPDIEPMIEAAAAASERGTLIVFPTDTVYGIGTRPDDPAATGLLFTAKARSADLTLPVLVPSVDVARQAAAFDGRAERLAEACWPGPVTLVLPRTASSGRWDLGGDAETVGLRVPAHPLALALLARTGPLAVTSANRSGDPPCRTCDELVAAFGDLVAVYLCEDEPLEAAPSAVVDLAHGDPSVLREGAITREDLDRLLAGGGPALDSRPPRAGSPGTTRIADPE